MSRTRNTIGVCALAAGLALGGCAPVTFASAPGVGISTGPGFGVGLSSCATLGLRSPNAARMGIGPSAAVSMSAFRNWVALMQDAPLASSLSAGARLESWKRIASGEC